MAILQQCQFRTHSGHSGPAHGQVNRLEFNAHKLLSFGRMLGMCVCVWGMAINNVI